MKLQAHHIYLQGVLSCTLLALLLASCTGAPAPVILPDAITNIAFTAAGGRLHCYRSSCHTVFIFWSALATAPAETSAQAIGQP